MATQHPDNASAPPFSANPFISSDLEMGEVFHSFSTLGCDEYMWDFEGKFADEAMIERLFSSHLPFFKKNRLGKERNITLRIPNIWEEKTFKLPRAYMSILSAGELATALKLPVPPIFEVILPMTKSADQLIHIQKTFKETAQLHEGIFHHASFGEGYLHIIPLFESIDDLAGCASILTDYIHLHEKTFHQPPPPLRVFLARSDPALNAGFVPAVLGVRLALRELQRLSKKFGVPFYPIIGTGSLPFRGGINPENIQTSLPEYEGAKTLTIQSAFRYDYPKKDVKKALDFIKKTLAKPTSLSFSDEEFSSLRKLCTIFEKTYRPTVEAMAPLINRMAEHIPKRRERIQHTGLFGYNRGVGKVSLPRAIQFTGACYSLGIPPEFIGLGRGLEQAKKQGLLPMLEKHFFTLRSELSHAGKFINIENLERFAKKHTFAKDILSDIHGAEEILGMPFKPQKDHHFLHRNLTSNIVLKLSLNENFSADILEAAVLRKSLG